MRHTSDGVAIDYLAIAILRQNDHVVMVRQQIPHDDRSYWVLPGGLVEAGELVVDALIREVQEESGVQITAIAHLACCSQIDLPARRAQTVAFIFEVETWQGTLSHHDPDAEVVEVELVAWNEAIHRLEQNGGWAGIQTPLLAYLRGTAPAGTFWFYREDTEGQQLIASVPAGDRASMSFPHVSSGNPGSTLPIETRP